MVYSKPKVEICVPYINKLKINNDQTEIFIVFVILSSFFFDSVYLNHCEEHLLLVIPCLLCVIPHFSIFI